MHRLVYLPAAVEDLSDIWGYLAEQSQSHEVADRMIDAIHETASVYATSPEVGSPRFELAARVRCFVVARYVVFYLPFEDGIEIIQVIHGSRDIPVHFRDT